MTEHRPPITSSLANGAVYYRVVFGTYLAVALIVFTFVVPPFQKNDEPLHFYRTISITNLDFFCRKDADGQYYSAMKRKYFELPQVLGAEPIWASLDAKFSPDLLRSDFSDPRFQEPVRAYSICNLPVPGYIPNALGALAGKPFTSPVVSFYLGRIAGVLFFLFCTVIALRVVPDRYRLVLYFYSALPMVLHQVSSFSYDAVQLSLFPLIFAYLTRFLVQDEQVSRRDLVTFMALLCLAVSIKSFAYDGILLLYLVIPPDKIATGAMRYLRVSAAFLTATVLTIAPFEAIYLSKSGLVNPQGGAIAPKGQIRFTLEHPWDFMAACYRTIEADGEVLLRQAIGVFGWVGFEVNFAVIYLVVLIAGLLAYYMVERDKAILSLPRVATLWLAVLVTVGSLFFSLYAVWSPVGAPVISGLQGRYFLGLVPFAMLAVSQTTSVLGPGRCARLLFVLLALLMIVSSFTAVYQRYY